MHPTLAMQRERGDSIMRRNAKAKPPGAALRGRHLHALMAGLEFNPDKDKHHELVVNWT